MDDNALDRLFSGDLDRLISLPKRVVRLFISSTFTDMTLERNTLMERVYPRLKKYCRERYGLDFQVVDMRWGVRDEATDDHQTVSLCSREIDNCQRMSLGPNFVALLGDKYGFRPLCNRIKSTEYRALRRCLIELDINTDFLDTWYKEDQNAIPPEHLLQPISSILKNFTNKSEPELQAVDQRIWMAIQDRLHQLLMIGSSRLVKQGRMSEQDQLMKYSISVTEREVIEGCLDVDDAKSHCLIYVRSITDLKTYLEKCLACLAEGGLSQQQQSNLSPIASRGSDSTTTSSSTKERKSSQTRKASLKIGDDSVSLTTSGAQNAAERRLENTRKLIGRYIDLTSKNNVWSVDQEAQGALINLREVKLRSRLKFNGRNLTHYKVAWNEQEGISLKSEAHKRYLNDLTEHFYTQLTRMLRKASKNEQEFKSGLIVEVLQHSHYANYVSKTFHGRINELNKIRSYILDSSDDSGSLPMFVYGVGGSGKTSILARTATMANEWILQAKHQQRSESAEDKWNQKPCVIMRFCCTTPNSSSMVGVLTSICRQLQFNFYQYGPLNGVVNQNNTKLQPDDQSSSGSQLPNQQIPEDFIRLVFTFRQILDNCQHHYHRQRQFLIILDSVERLSSPAESSVEAKYSWLTSIANLPPNVKMIISCSSQTTSESWAEDFRYLKRHFLKSYYDRRAPIWTPNSLSEHNFSDDKFSTISAEVDKQLTDNGEKYYLLKRLMVPAMRLLRGSKEDSTAMIDDRHYQPTMTSAGWSLVSKSPLSPVEPNCLGTTYVEDDHIDQKQLEKSVLSRRGEWLLHVQPMGVELALSVVRRWLNNIGRTLTHQQWSIVEKSFSECSSLPIFVKLVYGELINWKSYSMQSDTKGLTFGSALLENKQDLLIKESANNPAIKRLLEDSDCLNDEFRWQILSMEQQWSNYIDYRQRKQQQQTTEAGEESKQEDGSFVIRIRPSSSAGSTSSNVPLCHLSSSIDDAICQLFARIELQHGYVLTKHSLSYITAARNGICENELEDILSLDDVVLDDVFQYHLPPTRRIPPLLWTRIRNDLPDYLSERDADGIVVDWHHSQFKQVTHKRYLSDPLLLFHIHSTLADYFLGRWAGKAKPFRCTKQQIQMAAEQLESAVQKSIRDSQSFGKTSSGQRRSSSSRGRLGSGSTGVRSGVSFSVRNRLRSSDQHDRLQWMQAKADRRVPSQPLFYIHQSSLNENGLQELHDNIDANDKPLKKRYNLRKLTELPYHLMKAGRFLDLASVVLFNYKWLFAALDALGLQSLLVDFNEAARCLEKALSVRLANPIEHVGARNSSGVNVIDPDMELIGPDELDAKSLQFMINQLKVLNDAIRLSCSAIHSDTQMLAPQLIGRLLPLVQRSAFDASVKYLTQLLDQCDKEGCSDCALLPTDHCLQSPEGLQLSSLEGHSFAILSMSMTADQRHLLAVSNRFIMWDITTGEVSRDVDPKIDCSIMKQLKMAGNNELAIAYTSSNTIILLNILTQQIIKNHDLEHEMFQDQLDQILGIDLIDKFGASRFFVWTRSKWWILQVTNDSSTAKLAFAQQKVSIVQEYRVDLNSLDDTFDQILNLRLTVDKKLNDLSFVTTSLRGVQKGIQLLTVVAAPQVTTTKRTFTIWQQRFIMVESIALEPKTYSQLVFSDTNDDVYLSRRRQTCWSKPKLIRNGYRGVLDKWNNASANQINSMDYQNDNLHETENETNPLAIELVSKKNSAYDLDDTFSFDALKQTELADFERHIDAIQPDGEIEENCVFKSTREDCRPTGAKKRGENSAIQFVKLYLTHKIIVMRLDTSDLMAREKNLMLPKNIQNISVEQNNCQIKSVLLTSTDVNYLVVSLGRRLLLYSVGGEQLLKSIEAHNARIVELISITSLSLTGDRHLSIDNSGPLCFASASMDKTVKIWNLSNLDKDIHSLDKLDNPLESMCLSSQQPLAACLSRGELGIWDWRTLKLKVKLTQADFEDSRIVKCKFSTNGRYLGLATLDSIHLLSVDGSSSNHQRAPSSENKLSFDFKQSFRQHIPVAGLAKRLQFFFQDSRMLITLECTGSSSTIERKHSAENTSSGPALNLRLTRRILVLCYSVPDGRRLYTIDYSTPTIQSSNDSHYLQTAQSQPSNDFSRRRSSILRASSKVIGRSKGVRLPVLTRDELHVVTVEQSAHELFSGGGGEHDRSNLGRKSNSVIKLPTILQVYSSRDGVLMRTVDLNQLDQYDQRLVDKTNMSNQTRQSLLETGKAELAAGDKAARRGGLPVSNPAGNKSGSMGSSRISIGNEQFSRLKAVGHRERQSVVALIDDENGSSFLIDISTKQLMAFSSLWNGKVSSEGRYGLSRMFKTAATLRYTGNTSKSDLMLSKSTSSHDKLSGLQLLEMRHCTPIKPLITNETLATLSTSAAHSTGSDTDVICGFTRSNDDYVYYYDPRLKRLLLVRTRDGQLIANYKTAATVTKIKCSNDGYTLVLGQVDGSLCSLAIVDPQKNDTLIIDMIQSNPNGPLVSYETWMSAIVSSAFIGCTSLVPWLFNMTFFEHQKQQQHGENTGEDGRMKFLLSFAVGAILGDIFFHLVPESVQSHLLELNDSKVVAHQKVGLSIIAGIFMFIIVEMILEKWSHSVKDSEKEDIVDAGANDSIKQKLDEVIPIFTTKDLKETNGLSVHCEKGIKETLENNNNIMTNLNAFHVNNQDDNLMNGFNHINKNSNTLIDVNMRARNKNTSAKMVRKSGCSTKKGLDLEQDEFESRTKKNQNNGGHKIIDVAGYLSLIANGFDNFTHGLAIGASFLVGPKVGLLTTFVIFIHEIPHEICDYAILVNSGFSRWEAVKAQSSVSLFGILGTATALYVKSVQALNAKTIWILPFSAGGFLYIALVNLLPEVLDHKTDVRNSLGQVACVILGIAFMATVAVI